MVDVPLRGSRSSSLTSLYQNEDAARYPAYGEDRLRVRVCEANRHDLFSMQGTASWIGGETTSVS